MEIRLNFWQGKNVRLRGIEPSDADIFFAWNMELRYQKVSVAVHSYNEESIALHEKLGFVREGTLRRMVYTRGEYFDVHWYGMTKEEWERSG